MAASRLKTPHRLEYAPITIFLAVVIAVLALEASNARAQQVRSEPFLRHSFPGPISDIAECVGTNGTKQLVILGLRKGLILHEDRDGFEQFQFTNCMDATVTELPGTQSMVYCRAGGFGPVFLADLTGRIQWQFPKPTQGVIWRATAGPDGRFYVGTQRGTKILSHDGRVAKEFSFNLNRIEYFPTAPLLTFMEYPVRDQKPGVLGTIGVRDLELNVIKSFPVGEHPLAILMFDWPQKGTICYATLEDLVCLDAEGKEIHRSQLGNHLIGPKAALCHSPKGNSYLAVLIDQRKGSGDPKLFIFSSDFRKIYERSMPMSRGIKTLKWKSDQERLFVGVGSTGVDVYTISDGN